MQRRQAIANRILSDIRSAHNSVMIVSTQTPSNLPQPDGLTPGATGKLIQQLTQGGMVHMHRDKQIRINESMNEKEVFNKHLKPNGWLIITGHGGPESVKGQYSLCLSSEEKTILDISCSADDYINLVMQSETLKSGDHINIILYVCYAASRFNNQKSFAEQIAENFAHKGISTTIIASTCVVQRANSFENDFGDIRDTLLVFRTVTASIRILYTPPNDGKEKLETYVFAAAKRFFIMKHMMQFELSENSIKNAILNEGITTNDQLASEFHYNRQKAELYLAERVGEFIVRRSSKPNAFAISYCDKDLTIKHYIFFCEKGEDQQPRVARFQTNSVQQIIDEIHQLKSSQDDEDDLDLAAAFKQLGY